MVTSQKDQIQSLITEIERVLDTEKPRTPWIRASETESQRQALSKAQDYLIALQQSFEAPGGWGPVDPSTGQLITPQGSSGNDGDPAESGTPPQGISQETSQVQLPPISSAAEISQQTIEAQNKNADNVLQALLTEMKFLKSSALEPLRLEMDSLRTERDSLNEEVKGLTEQRNQVTLSLAQAHEQAAELAAARADMSQGARPEIDEQQLNEFLQALMTRLQERLSMQVTQTLEQLESDHSEAIARLSAATEAEVLQLQPSGQIEEMRQLQSRSDQLLSNIDLTLQGMFETLQKNIDSYQISLNEGIENMHSLGRQGEVIVRSLVDHLTQQLGQTTPPEPAFYSPKSAAINDYPGDYPGDYSIASASSATVNSADTVMSPQTDTVTSLNDVLPERNLATTNLQNTDFQDTGFQDTGFQDNQQAPNDQVALIDEANALSPEDCIREDGTIDLDLLKLDIERTDADESLSRDDLMIDSAVADAQVAATEDDSEIEAKVTPTPEAEFLADLTLDDFTVDSLQPETDTAGVDLASTTSVEEIITENYDTTGDTVEVDEGNQLLPAQTDIVENTSTLSASPEVVEVPAPELAAILPNLGVDEGVDETDTYSTAETSVEYMSIEETTSEEPAEPEDSSRQEESVINEVDESVVDESVVTDIETDSERPDSALTPDLPESDSEGIEDGPTEEAAGDYTTRSIDNTKTENEQNQPPEDLFTTLEENSEEAARTALALPDRDLDDLTSDLEEAIVFDEDIPVVQSLDEMATPLESALIPDMPDDGTDAQLADSLEDTLSDLEQEVPADSSNEVDEMTAASETASAPGEVTPEMPPEDFDDDLDFYANTQTKEYSAEDDRVAVEDSLSDEETQSVELASSVENDSAVTEQAGQGITADPWATTKESETDSKANLANTMSVTAASAAGIAGVSALLNDQSSTDEQATEASEQSAAGTLTSDEVRQDAVSDKAIGSEPPIEEGDSDPTGGEPAVWFLGIDFGTTGLSAVVINQLGDQVYPLCWNVAGDTEQNRFRLPSVVQIDTQMETTPAIGAVGPLALQQSEPVLRNLKLMVKAGIPNSIAGTPWMQWTDQMALPLSDLQAALNDLMATLSSQHMSCKAVGLKDSALRHILSNLSGVVVGYPTNWPDTYGFNIRETVVAAGLIDRPEKVFFIEESIAALLSALPLPQTSSEQPESQQPGLYNCNWTGGTVVISAGSTLTEAAMVDLPADLSQLSYTDFALRSYTYAGDGIDQDIVCQLMHGPLQADAVGAPAGSGSDAWAGLELDKLQLPRPGEADRVNRHRLRQRLNDSALGREALAAARELKIALQEENEVDVEVGDRTFTINRKALETKVFLPYVQRINRQINSLLSQKNVSAQGIKQVICTGGSASLGTIARWLRQKFPNATIIQDTYTGEYSNSCSRVAYGLANLCHYPNVLDSNRHQYNDYFLLMELLRILPDQPLPAGGILHLLKQRGINTQTCQAHVLALIEGHLPPGLVPTAGDRPLISAQSSDIETYQALAELPLFRKQGGQIYIADMQQGDRLRNHLEALLIDKSQSLSEPMSTSALTSPIATGVGV